MSKDCNGRASECRGYFRKRRQISSVDTPAPALLYFGVAIIITIRAYSEMLTLVFLSSTPLWAIQLLLISIAFLMAWQGMGKMARTSVLLVILFTIPIIFVLCFSFQNVDWYYLRRSLTRVNRSIFLLNLIFWSVYSYMRAVSFPGAVTAIYTDQHQK